MPAELLNRVFRHLRMLAYAEHGRDLTDQDLLERFIATREEAAFTLLVQRHGAMVLGVCRRVLRDLDLADDAFQATFVVLARRASSIRKHSAIGSWLFGVALRVALRAKSQTLTRRHHERQAGMCRRETADETTWEQLRGFLDEEIAGLPENMRAALVLSYLEGKSQVQVAAELGCARSTVQRWLEEARQHLREGLDKRGVALTTTALTTVLTEQAAGAMPPILTLNAVRAVMLGTVTTSTAVLADAVTKAMLTAKIRSVAGVLLMLGALVGGATVAAQQALPAKPQSAGQADSPAAAQGLLPQENQVRTDANGDPLPEGAVARLGSLRFLSQAAYWLGFTPDGATLLSATQCWDVNTGRERWPAEKLITHASALSPDGTVLARGNDEGVRLWNVATGKELAPLKGTRLAFSLAFSPDASWLAVSEASADLRGGVINLWDYRTAKKLRQVAAGSYLGLYSHQALAISPDGKSLAFVGPTRKVAQLWDLSSDTKLHELKADNASFNSLVFSRDSKMLITAGWEKFGESDDLIRLWDRDTGKEIKQLRGQEREVRSLAVAPDGRLLASCGHDGTIRLWDLATGKEARRLTSQAGPVLSLAFSADGALLASGGFGRIRLWDVASGIERGPHAGPMSEVQFVGFTSDGKNLVALANDQLGLWSVQTGWVQPIKRLPDGHIGEALSFDGKLLVTRRLRDWAIHVWEVASGKEVGHFTGKGPALAALSPDGKLLAFDDEDTVQTWDLVSGRKVRQIDDNAGLGPVAFSPDGRTLAAFRRSNAKRESSFCLWQVDTAKENWRLSFDLHFCDGLAFSPDGRLLATAGYKSDQKVIETFIVLWDAKDGREIRRCPGMPGRIWSVAFSPDGRMLATGGPNGDIHFWEVMTAQERDRRTGNNSPAMRLSFSPDNRLLASADFKHTALLWDLGGRKSLPALKPQERLELWEALAGADARRAYDAIQRFTADPVQTVRFLRERVRPADALPERRLEQLVRDLDHPKFAVREAANQDLTKLGQRAIPALRKSLEDKHSLEMRRRLERLLEKTDHWTTEELRETRSVEVLERTDTVEARQLLQSLAAGAPEARLTQEAKASLDRLGKRTPR